MASTDIENRIIAERERLATEERREAELTAQRAGPLESGDDAAPDAIEQQISDSRTTQLRIQERIDLLSHRLTDEQRAEHERTLDQIAASAGKAREIGEKLIRSDYTKQAKARRSNEAVEKQASILLQ